MLIAAAFEDLNWLAVIVAWVGHIVISLIWYQPMFFGKAWVRLSGKEMVPSTRWMPVGAFAHLVAVLALAVLLRMTNTTSITDALLLSLLISVCFMGAILAGELVWEKIPFKLFLIRLGDQILTLCLASILFILWK